MSEAKSGAHSMPRRVYFLDSLTDRDRLYLQFDLFREEFHRELRSALSLAGLSTDPENARWRLVDVCCGEGLYSADLASWLPHVRVVGFDRDERAIETAKAAYSDQGLKFHVQDAHDPIPDSYDQPDGSHGEGFDVALMWFATAHCHTPLRVFENVFRALKPGGVLLVLDPTLRAYVFSHPSMEPVAAGFMETWKKFGNHDAGSKHVTHLPQAGFTLIENAAHRYPMDIVDEQHLRMLTLIIATLASAKRAIVEMGRFLSAEDFDRYIHDLQTSCTSEMTGFAEVVISIARRPA